MLTAWRKPGRSQQYAKMLTSPSGPTWGPVSVKAWQGNILSGGESEEGLEETVWVSRLSGQLYTHRWVMDGYTQVTSKLQMSRYQHSSPVIKICQSTADIDYFPMLRVTLCKKFHCHHVVLSCLGGLSYNSAVDKVEDRATLHSRVLTTAPQWLKALNLIYQTYFFM